MRVPSSAELLQAWEHGLSAPPALRGLALLTAASDGEPPEALTQLSVGERDRRLLTLREWTFGPALTNVAECAACGESLEWSIRTSELCASAPVAASELSVERGLYRVHFRLPTTADLSALMPGAGDGDAADPGDVLLARCIVRAECDGEPIDVDAVPEDVRQAIDAAMAAADPQADTTFDLACPACGHAWMVALDIESYFWRELTAWAERVLQDVHALACAYGWSERDILALSAWRRQFYLSQVGV